MAGMQSSVKEQKVCMNIKQKSTRMCSIQSKLSQM